MFFLCMETAKNIPQGTSFQAMYFELKNRDGHQINMLACFKKIISKHVKDISKQNEFFTTETNFRGSLGNRILPDPRGRK